MAARVCLALVRLVPLDGGLPVACALSCVGFEGYFASVY